MVEKTEKDEGYDRIYGDIIMFQLKPGARISERVLVEKYALGKAASRTVLLRLVQDGLIENKGRSGHKVNPITLESIRNVIDLRLILEPAAAELAAGQVDSERLSTLNRGTNIDTPISDWRANARYLEANRDLHVAIAEYAGNRKMALWIRHLHNLSFRIFCLLEQSGCTIAGGHESHQTIIDALAAGDSSQAAELTRSHIQRTREQVLSAVVDLPELQHVHISAT